MLDEVFQRSLNADEPPIYYSDSLKALLVCGKERHGNRDEARAGRRQLESSLGTRSPASDESRGWPCQALVCLSASRIAQDIDRAGAHIDRSYAPVGPSHSLTGADPPCRFVRQMRGADRCGTPPTTTRQSSRRPRDRWRSCGRRHIGLFGPEPSCRRLNVGRAKAVARVTLTRGRARRRSRLKVASRYLTLRSCSLLFISVYFRARVEAIPSTLLLLLLRSRKVERVVLTMTVS